MKKLKGVFIRNFKIPVKQLKIQENGRYYKMKRVNLQQYKALTSYCSVKIISADDTDTDKSDAGTSGSTENITNNTDMDVNTAASRTTWD